ncbi:hypothetical protein [Chryseobacterium vrystaatense]|uniref:Uncharacterized protein n=1 Tax=Chryseobacterium vrystaatense TaxID=307480 RepID=A0A1M5HCM7_9FLAO|nr:hypothetical protein [Chryseobacterium vrystaatense]SHG13716.1 hypothetical protein SAMN02787073_3660 [Chryseobacterium vrystaatense]
MGITESIKIIANMLGVDEEKFNTVTNEVYLNNKMNGDDCRQLIDLGFPIFDEIAKLKGCSKAEVKELIQLGKVTAVDYNNIIITNYFIQKHNELFIIKISTNGIAVDVDFRDILEVTTTINTEGNLCLIKLIDGTLIETLEVELNAELKRVNAKEYLKR